jgi:hypothetical protein
MRPARALLMSLALCIADAAATSNARDERCAFGAEVPAICWCETAV